MRTIAEKSLFPVIDLPTFVRPRKNISEKYKYSVYWDIEKGDFVRDGKNGIVQSSGKEAYMQWCHKMVHTERFAYLAYSNSVGVEMQEALKQPNHEATESCVELTITEALLINPFTEYVRDFSFIWEGDTVICEFLVKGKDWEEFKLNLEIGKDVMGYDT